MSLQKSKLPRLIDKHEQVQKVEKLPVKKESKKK